MEYVYLNGKFVKSDEAMVSVFDQGFLYGDGIFESFRSIGDQLYHFPQHYQRLVQSAEASATPLPAHSSIWKKSCSSCADATSSTTPIIASPLPEAREISAFSVIYPIT